MKKIIPLIGGVCGVISGIGMIFGAILDGNIPKYAWIIIIIGFLVSGAGNIYNYHYFSKKDKK